MIFSWHARIPLRTLFWRDMWACGERDQPPDGLFVLNDYRSAMGRRLGACFALRFAAVLPVPGGCRLAFAAFPGKYPLEFCRLACIDARDVERSPLASGFTMA
jgi:hypothetical protein